MDEYEHTDLLVLQSAELTELTPFCPDDQAIAEYFEGEISEKDLRALGRHLADCRYCRARIGMLNRQQDETLSERVPGELLAAAKTLSRNTAPSRHMKAPAWAMAAIVLLGVFLLAIKQPLEIPEPRQLRNIDRIESSLEVTMPGFVPGNGIKTGSTIRWTAISGEHHYTVYVLSDAGDILWTEHLQNNEWALPGSLQLDADADYFFRVEAELPNGGKISSSHLAFRVTDP